MASRGVDRPARVVVPALVVLLLAAAQVLVGAGLAPARPAAAQEAPAAPVEPEVTAEVAADGTAEVIAVTDRPGDEVVDEVVAALEPDDAGQVRDAGPARQVALTVDADGLEDLRTAPGVERVVPNHKNFIESDAWTTSIEAPDVWAGGNVGAGRTVAVLDTGVQRDHPYLMRGSTSKVVAEACFSHAGPFEVGSCPGANPTSAVGVGAARPCDYSRCDHGTHVAGLIAGGPNDSLHLSGVAPGADLVAVQVFTKGTSSYVCGSSSSCVYAYDSDVNDALAWLYEQKVAGAPGFATLDAVNLSLGGATYTGTCDSSATKPYVDQLRSLGVVTVAAAGNDGKKGYQSSPACISTVVGVGAVDDTTGQVAYFSNVNGLTDLLAPGYSLRSSVTGSTYGTKSGTSMAAPVASGAVALAVAAVPGATGVQSAALLKSLGSPQTVAWSSGAATLPVLDVGLLQPELSGTVTGPDGTPLAGATVTADGPEVASTTTSSDGTYSLAALEQGSYTVSFDAPGHRPFWFDQALAGPGTPVDVVAGADTAGVDASMVTDDALSPLFPGGVSAVVDGTTADVSWAPAQQRGAAVTGYVVTASPGGAQCTTAGLTCTVRGLASGTSYTFTVEATSLVGPSGGSSPSAAVDVAVTGLHAMSPVRVMDTREGLGGGTFATGTVRRVDTTAAEVPASATAVVANVTVTNPTLPSYLTAYPSGARPEASNLNFTAGQTVPNLITIELDGAGGFLLYNHSGTTDVLVDVVGWYGHDTGALLHPLSPQRVMDTRRGQGGGRFSTGTVRVVDTTTAGVPGDAVAVVANVTVTDPSSPSFLTAYPSGARPEASNLNFTAGQTVPNLVTVRLDGSGRFRLYNHSGTADVVVDVVGWYDEAGAGGSFEGRDPERVMDTRRGQGGGRFSTGTVRVVDTTTAGVPGDAVAVVANVTVTDPSSPSFLTAYPSGARPEASNLNFTAGQTVPNLVTVRLDGSGRFRLYNHSGTADVVVDVVGWYER